MMLQTLKRLDHLADVLIAPSYSRMAMAWRPKLWDPADLAVNLAGRVAVVTGGNSGIGKSAALTLAEKGCKVVIVSRNAERGLEAAEELRTLTKKDLIDLEIADLSLLSNVRAVATRISEKYGTIDFLVNNAGTFNVKREMTEEGLERVFATNVVAPFLLTRLLLPCLSKSKAGRVVFVSSGGMYMTRLNVDDPQFVNRKFTDLASYAESKRALVVLNELFAQKFSAEHVSFYCMHPGWVRTPILKAGMPTFSALFGKILRDPWQGADTIVWLVACKRIQEQTGLFWFDRKPRAIHVSKKTRTTKLQADQLWDICEKLTSRD
ncbi:MAG: SDR family NAD(P)-dependent oxidoreductase [Bdellovibrionia bacterium]